MYTIYCHKNKINGKMYFGQTKQKPEIRWNDGKGYIGCPAFYKAIQKYGWDNFEHIIMFEGLTHIQANYYEKYLIKIYNTQNSKYGYNLMNGGSVDSAYGNAVRLSKFNAVEKTVIRFIKDNNLLSKSGKVIADLLTQNNIATKTKYKWSEKAVNRMLAKFNLNGSRDDYSIRLEELYSEGKKYAEIASILISEGYRTKQGKEFNVKTIENYVSRKLKNNK